MEDEMAGSRETHVTNDKCMKGFGGGTWR